MKRKIDKNSTLFNFFRDYYAFIQEFAVPENKDMFWDNLMKAANDLTKKYKDIEDYCKDLCWAHIRALERQYKQMWHQEQLDV